MNRDTCDLLALTTPRPLVRWRLEAPTHLPHRELAEEEHARAHRRLEIDERLQRTQWGTYVPLPDLRITAKPVSVTLVAPAWMARPAEDGPGRRWVL